MMQFVVSVMQAVRSHLNLEKIRLFYVIIALKNQNQKGEILNEILLDALEKKNNEMNHFETTNTLRVVQRNFIQIYGKNCLKF